MWRWQLVFLLSCPSLVVELGLYHLFLFISSSFAASSSPSLVSSASSSLICGRGLRCLLQRRPRPSSSSRRRPPATSSSPLRLRRRRPRRRRSAPAICVLQPLLISLRSCFSSMPPSASFFADRLVSLSKRPLLLLSLSALAAAAGGGGRSATSSVSSSSTLVVLAPKMAIAAMRTNQRSRVLHVRGCGDVHTVGTCGRRCRSIGGAHTVQKGLAGVSREAHVRTHVQLHAHVRGLLRWMVAVDRDSSTCGTAETRRIQTKMEVHTRTA